MAIATRSKLARELALSAGIDLAIDTTREDVGERLREVTNGLGPDFAFDAVGGKQRYVQQGIDIVRRGGKVGVLGGFPAQPVELGGDFLIKEVDVVASFSYARWGALSEFQIALDGLAAGKFHGRQYISQRFPLDEIAHAFEVAQHKGGQDAIKVSIVF